MTGTFRRFGTRFALDFQVAYVSIRQRRPVTGFVVPLRHDEADVPRGSD
jgi:hypothetical protein